MTESISRTESEIVTNLEKRTKSFPLPWDRFWARCIDLLINLLIIFLIYLIYFYFKISGHNWSQFHNSISVKLLETVIVLVILFIEFSLYESLFLHFFGATPGKALFRIKVTDSERQYLSFRAALVRSIYVYWYGHFFSLFTPDGYLVGYLLSGYHYKKIGTFRWDKASKSIVSQNPLNPLRRKLIILFAFIFLILREIPLLILVLFFTELSKL